MRDMIVRTHLLDNSSNSIWVGDLFGVGLLVYLDNTDGVRAAIANECD
jgi:hypothetical protein